MAHDWEDAAQGMGGMFNHGKRTCKNCGVSQIKEATQLWGRVTGYRWVPLAGVCKPKSGGD